MVECAALADTAERSSLWSARLDRFLRLTGTFDLPACLCREILMLRSAGVPTEAICHDFRSRASCRWR